MIAQGINNFLTLTAATEKQYTLVTFDNNDTSNIITTSDSWLFGTVLVNTLHPSSFKEIFVEPDEFLNQPVMSLEALLQALELINVQPAIINVFTTSTPTISAAVTLDIFRILENQAIQVNFYVAHFLAEILTGAGADLMQSIATFSGGRMIYSGNFITAPNQFANIIQQYLPMIVEENGLVSEYVVPACNVTPAVMYVQVDYGAKWFSLTAVGTKLTISLLDAAGQPYYLNNTGDIISNGKGTSMILRILNNNNNASYAFAGQWTVTVKTLSGGCTLQARVKSEIQVNYGYAMSSIVDFVNAQPFSGGDPNFVLANIPNSLIKSNVTLDTFTVSSYNMSSVPGQNLTTVQFHPRDSSCAYQFYSDPFHCPIATIFSVKIAGRDSNGNPFERITATHCSPPNCTNGGMLLPNGACNCTSLWTGYECSLPICFNGGTLDISVCNCRTGYFGVHCEQSITYPTTTTTMYSVPTTPQNPTCDVSQLKIDIILMADASNSAKEQGYLDQLTVMQSLLSKYSISSTFTQAIVNAYSYIPSIGQADMIGNLNTFDSNAAIQHMFSLLKSRYSGTPMQYTNYLKVVKDHQLTVNDGLRPSAQHAVVIFSTGLTTASDIDAAATVTASMRESGVAIWGVAFGNTDVEVATQLAKLTRSGIQCVFNAPHGISQQSDIVFWIMQQSCLNPRICWDH